MSTLAANLASAPLAQLHDRFLALVPRIETHARIAFRQLKCPDSRNDAVAESVALAWHWYQRLARRGKDAAEFAAALARFAARRVRAGRRLCGVENGKDILVNRTQRRFGFSVGTLPTYSTLEGTPLEEALQDNTVSPVPEQAAFRIDFPEWLSTLSDREREMVEDLAVGRQTREVARKFGVTAGAVSHRRRDFHRSWLRYQGESAG
jgi:hypothetical protein